MIYLKSSSEIAIMRENGKILVEIFEKLREFIKPGVSTKDVDNLVENIIYSHSAVPSFKNYRGFPAAACVSINEEVVHGIPTASRVLEDGDIVGIDVGAFKNGFHADAARTFAVGEISAEAKKLIDVTEQSFFEGIKAASIGNRVSDISHAIQKYVELHGFGVIRDMLGHGIGRSLHEEPSVPNYGPPGKGVKLRAGLVLAIEPMVSEGDYRIVTLHDGWTTVTKDGKLSAHYENTVAITPDGVSVLTLN
ncbi:MAG: type I methionyl aminopeptidase [Deferribacteraceae bacterium]|jgi:methionyl aminopeptidase|nr:type I methionyl aminopeptidase [Deferribacteraceae bacterium]